MTNPTQRLLQKSRLRQWLAEVSATASTSGALQSSKTDIEIIEDGFPFEVRVLSNLRRKPKRISNDSSARNPFLPYDKDLYVAHLQSGHVVLLNKFNVVNDHFLIVTPEFEEQEAVLSQQEFSAMAEVMPEFPVLFFYNSGEMAGASQAHKHLQAIPLESLPISTALQELDGKIQVLESLPFKHRVAALTTSNSSKQQADECYSLYLQMLDELTLAPEEKAEHPAPYNLLMTPDWIMVIPRTEGGYQGISVNALGFAGLLLVKDRERLRELQEVGPGHLLKSVTEPIQ